MAAPASSESPVLTGKHIPGYCIVLDLVTTERNKSSWSSLNEEIDQVCKLFSGFNYDVKLIRNKRETEIRSELKTIKDNINDNHGSLVFIVFDNQWEKSGIGDDVKWRPSSNAPDLYREFDEVRCKPLRNKSKIFLRHSFRQATGDVSATVVTSERLQNTFSASSVIAGPKSEIQQQKSILVQTLVEIGSSCEHGTCLVELFSKVCTQVEEQCSKLHPKTEDVFQNITFYKNIKSFKDPVIKQDLKTLVKTPQSASEVKRDNDTGTNKAIKDVKEEITPSSAKPSSVSTTVKETTGVTDTEHKADKEDTTPSTAEPSSTSTTETTNKVDTTPSTAEPSSASTTETTDKEDTKPSTTEPASASTTETTGVEDKGPGVQGLCVLLDLVTTEENKDTWKTLTSHIDDVRVLFKQLNYDVIYIHDKRISGIQSYLKKLKASIENEHTSIVVIWLGKDEAGKSTRNLPFEYYWEMFNEDQCKPLRNKPKILLQHTFMLSKDKDTKEDDASVVDRSTDNTFHVTSTMTGPKNKIMEQKSLFLESLVDICRRYAHEDELIEFFTKVCNDVEIRQYNDLHGKESDENAIMQRIAFKTKLSMEFKFIQESKVTTDDLPSLAKPTIADTKDIKKKLQIEVMKELADDHRYEMTHNPRGICVIINISNDRTGSRIDELRMINLFEELMFKTKVIRNKRHSEIRQRLKEISDEITDTDQSFFLFLMGHGGKEDGSDAHVFYDIEGAEEKSEYIFKTFDGHNCENLIRRPKIFIVQTCFGVSRMEGLNSPEKADTSKLASGDNIIFIQTDDPGSTADRVKSPEDTREKRQAPHAMSDTLIYTATLLGHKSYRLPSGSLIIKAIDEIFRKWSATDDVHKLLNRVSGRVSTGPLNEYQMSTGKTVPAWQQPAFKEETLNKVLYMNPGFQKDHLSIIIQLPQSHISKEAELGSV